MKKKRMLLLSNVNVNIKRLFDWKVYWIFIYWTGGLLQRFIRLDH